MDKYEISIVQRRDKDGNELPFNREYEFIVFGKGSLNRLMDFVFEATDAELTAKMIED